MNFEETVDVLILGAGASGLMAAAEAARSGASVVLADGNEKVGRKLYATGNGRCNFTNTGCSAEDFNAPADGFVEAVLRQFTPADSRAYFEQRGMLSREEQEGRCYPYAGQAASLVGALERDVRRLGVRLLLGDPAVSCARSEDGRFSVPPGADGEPRQADARAKRGPADASWPGPHRFLVQFRSGRRLRARALIIACGGRAGLIFGSTGDGYGFARALGHTLRAPRPALVPCLSDDPVVRQLKGRARARVTLYEDDAVSAVEQGEVQFTGRGLSGICVMDLTRWMKTARPAAKNKRKAKTAEPDGSAVYEIAIDFVPERTEEELRAFLEAAMDDAAPHGAQGKADGEKTGGRTAAAPAGAALAEALSGILSAHNAAVLAAQCRSAADAARILKTLRVRIAATQGWNDAQVTSGGVRREEVDPATLESRRTPGLFFCGEVLDVDGRCGGYNLQWAWASGHVCGRQAARYGDREDASITPD